MTQDQTLREILEQCTNEQLSALVGPKKQDRLPTEQSVIIQDDDDKALLGTLVERGKEIEQALNDRRIEQVRSTANGSQIQGEDRSPETALLNEEMERLKEGLRALVVGATVKASAKDPEGIARFIAGRIPEVDQQLVGWLANVLPPVPEFELR